jgi:uncharacterized membrane protein HdeD (DUF308 family)
MAAAPPPTGSGPELPGNVARELRERLREHWKALVTVGVIVVLVGVAAIIVPALASVTVELFVGWLLVFGGVAQIFDSFSVRNDAGRVATRLLIGLLSIVAGVLLLINPAEGTLTLTVILVAWFAAMGLLRLYAAWRERGSQGAPVVALNGAISLVLAILILVELPSSAAWAIGLLVGVDFVFAGFALITAGMEARKPDPA